MTVLDYLDYIARLKGVPAADARSRAVQWLNRIELPGVERKKCQELSKGMQQKVQFLAAVIHEPELIILDEPFSGLDPVNAALLSRLIRDLRAQGKTIIFSTHILYQAEQICDRFFLINKGAKVLDATLAEIAARFDPRTIVVEPLNGALDLDGLPGIRRVKRISDTARWEIEVDVNVDRQEIMRRIASIGALRSIELGRLTLDEVFVRVVQADRGNEAAEIAREELSHAQ
jgi:ABC-2 type transport system ATP-binding protein